MNSLMSVSMSSTPSRYDTLYNTEERSACRCHDTPDANEKVRKVDMRSRKGCLRVWPSLVSKGIGGRPSFSQLFLRLVLFVLLPVSPLPVMVLTASLLGGIYCWLVHTNEVINLCSSGAGD